MMSAQENQVPLPLRSHTIFGVCEAIGEDFGFNPCFLRVLSPRRCCGARCSRSAAISPSAQWFSPRACSFPNAKHPSAVEAASQLHEIEVAERQLPLAA